MNESIKERKKMKASAINELIGGAEPNWEKDAKPISFIRGLNWYSNQKDVKDSKAYTLQYMKEMKYTGEQIKKVSLIDDKEFKNIGFVCRMKSRGCQLEPNQIISIDNKINSLLNYEQSVKIGSVVAVNQPITTEIVQDKTYTQSTLYINEIEGFVDSLLQKKQINFKPYDYLVSVSAKTIHAKQIIEHFTPMMLELTEALNGKDEQLNQAYSVFKKVELKRVLDFVSSVIEDSQQLSSNTKVTRKPRKKKTISADKKVAKLNYKKEDVSFKVVSINPTEILGSKQLWVFNTKTKKLGMYVAKDDSGFSVKGSSIENFNETLSIHKTVRKPLEILPSVLSGTKLSIKKIIPQINSVEGKLNGRINVDTILLRVTK